MDDSLACRNKYSHRFKFK